MKKTLRIRTISQWHLLKQFNSYLGKSKIPEIVMRRIYHILCSNELGKDGFLIVCLNKIKDDYQGIIGMYPNKLWIEERMDEILTRNRKGKPQSWYVTYIKCVGRRFSLFIQQKTRMITGGMNGDRNSVSKLGAFPALCAEKGKYFAEGGMV